jgi:geranylgeranyl diphosphate synthase type I
MELPSVFLRYRSNIDAEIRAVFADLHSPMYDMLRYHLGWINEDGKPFSNNGGKAVRSTLCMLSNEAIAGNCERALPAAAALELLHNFSLIHDDIQDNDRERRNRPTVWAIYGKPQAINAGTLMRVLASLAMMRLAQRNVTVEKQLKAIRILDETCLQLIEGQYLDLSYEDQSDVSISDYLRMIKLKTVALIGCSLELGAFLATEDESTIQRFRKCGEYLGFAFQIKDDLLGIWGNQDKIGKPVGSDIRQKKKTFPLLYAWENASPGSKSKLDEIYQSTLINENLQAEVLSILDSVQAKTHTQSTVADYCSKAMTSLDEIELTPVTHELFAEVIDFLAYRNH